MTCPMRLKRWKDIPEDTMIVDAEIENEGAEQLYIDWLYTQRLEIPVDPADDHVWNEDFALYILNASDVADILEDDNWLALGPTVPNSLSETSHRTR